MLIQVLNSLTTVILYVLGCDPLPPCAGSVKDWIRGLAPMRKAETLTSRREGHETPLADSEAA
jgi:hypothetical protein